MYYEILYFHKDIDRDMIEVMLLNQKTLEFDHKGIHRNYRVYIIESPKHIDILNARHFQNTVNTNPNEPYQWGHVAD